MPLRLPTTLDFMSTLKRPNALEAQSALRTMPFAVMLNLPTRRGKTNEISDWRKLTTSMTSWTTPFLRPMRLERSSGANPAGAIEWRRVDAERTLLGHPEIESRLAAALEIANLRIAAAHHRSLAHYVALLAQWNRAYNLTAVRDPFAMIDRHVLDSLTTLDFLVGTRLLDAGTGAGLPGLVLAIVRPDVRCTLLDPVRKKTRFCAHAAMTLGLDNVEVASERLGAHRPPHRYSTVISRATFSVADLVAGARPLLDAPGRIIAMKGPHPEAELDALDREGLEVRVEPAGTGTGRRAATTIVLVDRAGRTDGVPAQLDVTIG